MRRIFELYANGTSPRSIAALLNSEGVPSPGARWKRTERRTDRKWLASAIHGDVTRGTGILNNRRYLGIVSWGRSEWKRSAADSAKRRHRMLKAGSAHETTDERLQLVPTALWDRVKARQELRSHEVGVRVKGGLRRHVRPSKYLLSGLLRCAACESSFVLSNGSRYQCATHVNGDACGVTLSLPRERAERRILDCIEVDLLNPARLADLEARYRSEGVRPAVDHSRRIAELNREIQNIGDAIAKGLVSDALAGRLQAAEVERGRLIAAQAKPTGEPRMPSSATLERRVESMRKRLASGGEVARHVLRELLPKGIWLQPDESGKFLWAKMGSAQRCSISLWGCSTATPGTFRS
jgi:site-specific DNA recombinase